MPTEAVTPVSLYEIRFFYSLIRFVFVEQTFHLPIRIAYEIVTSQLIRSISVGALNKKQSPFSVRIYPSSPPSILRTSNKRRFSRCSARKAV